MNGSYDHIQVTLSVLLAVAASYAALELSGRVTAARGRMRVAWLTGGALVMGTGIWSMHYVGMLALQLPITVRYHWPTVLLSLISGIVCSAFALILVSWRKMGLAYVLAGSVFMGGGIVALHYIGISAMRLTARCQFDGFLVALSVVLAVIFSLVALWLAFYFRNEPHNPMLRKAGSAVIMGAAISAMHYTAMAAVTFVPTTVNPEFTHAVSSSSLGTTGIGAVTLIVLGLAILTCSIDRRFGAQKLELALAESKLELARVNRIATVGELTASIAHEINQPLNAIVMGASAALGWISSEPPNLAEAGQTLAKTIQEANRASDVIAKIRALLAKATPEIRSLNMNDVAREVLSLTRGELAKRGIAVKTELAAELPPVRGDRVQLQQVMLNLVLNAIEAMASNGDHARELIIKSEKDTDGILIQIIDSGAGLDPEQAQRIFQPFFTTKPQGLGMGLAISRSIIEAHGGHLSARRRNSDGAIFEVRLPAERMK
jgi:NO-binding membrane sensor protein with MHYT domain/nitrogen-specific signal transduction histidine kinase